MSINEIDKEDIAVRFDIDMEKLEQLAAIGYAPETIAKYFDVKVPDFMHYFNKPDSLIRHHYDRGILDNQVKEGVKMLEAAEKGNTTQAQRLDKLRYQVNFEQQKNKLVYGEDEDDI